MAEENSDLEQENSANNTTVKSAEDQQSDAINLESIVDSIQTKAEIKEDSQEENFGTNGNKKQLTQKQKVEIIGKIKVTISVMAAEGKFCIKELTSLRKGDLLNFETGAHQLLDIYVNDRLFAKGKPVAIGDEYGISIAEILHPLSQENIPEEQDE